MPNLRLPLHKINRIVAETTTTQALHLDRQSGQNHRRRQNAGTKRWFPTTRNRSPSPLYAQFK
jgi:hypothetical protein